LVGLYFICYVCDLGFMRWSESYRLCNADMRRNINTYVLELFLGTALMIWNSINIHFAKTDKFGINQQTVPYIEHSLLVGMLIVVLYAFELIYRNNLRWPMITHHIFTIVIAMFGIARLERSLKLSIFLNLEILLLTALTEQPIHIALMMYRFHFKKYVAELFYFSAIQNFVVKFGLHIWGGIIWGKHIKDGDLAWEIFFPILAVLLFFVQIYASWIQWQLGDRVARNIKKQSEVEKQPEFTTTKDAVVAKESKHRQHVSVTTEEVAMEPVYRIANREHRKTLSSLRPEDFAILRQQLQSEKPDSKMQRFINKFSASLPTQPIYCSSSDEELGYTSKNSSHPTS